MKRKSFNFYFSYWEQIKLLNNRQKVEILEAICKVQFLEVNIIDVSFTDQMTNLVWTGIKHSVNTSLEGYTNKQLGLKKDVIIPLPSNELPPCQPPIQPPSGQLEIDNIQLTISNIKIETWQRWIDFKKSQFNFNYKSLVSEQTAINELIKLSGDNDNKANLIIDQSISNGWKGLFELKNNDKNNKPEEKKIQKGYMVQKYGCLERFIPLEIWDNYFKQEETQLISYRYVERAAI